MSLTMLLTILLTTSLIVHLENMFNTRSQEVVDMLRDV